MLNNRQSSKQNRDQTQAAQSRLKTVTQHPFNAEALPRALHSHITPTDLFYVRNNFEVPCVDSPTWRLQIGGLVQKELILSLEQLKALPKRTVVATLECAGNGRVHYEPLPEGTAWENGAISTAIWTGVALSDVLAIATPMAECKEVKFTGMDRGEVDGVEIPFARSLPLGKALDQDTLLVYAMNGEPLTSDHGYPLRLIVPNWYAVAAVKWLSRIELLGTAFTGHFQTAKYMMRYSPADPGKPVNNMVVKSLIVNPVTGARVPQNFPCRIAGKAWSGNGSIRGVEVSTDGGATWHQADVGENPSPYSWKSWVHTWIPTHAGVHRLCVRATDARGNLQPTVPEWNVDGYQYNGIHSVQVVVE